MPRVQAIRTRLRWFAGLRNPYAFLIGGAALGLPEHALRPGQVVKAGVPPVREDLVFPGDLVTAPAGPAAAVFSMPRWVTGAAGSPSARGFLMSLTLVRPTMAGAAGSLTIAARPQPARPRKPAVPVPAG